MKAETEAERLRRRGFDGLYHPTEPCGCGIHHLRPCGEVRTGCRGAEYREVNDAPGWFRPTSSVGEVA